MNIIIKLLEISLAFFTRVPNWSFLTISLAQKKCTDVKLLIFKWGFFSALWKEYSTITTCVVTVTVVITAAWEAFSPNLFFKFCDKLMLVHTQLSVFVMLIHVSTIKYQTHSAYSRVGNTLPCLHRPDTCKPT